MHIIVLAFKRRMRCFSGANTIPGGTTVIPSAPLIEARMAICKWGKEMYSYEQKPGII